ncbi:hypothetical protein BV22DRAFT_252227 [Leucogyrophana mollusca]|uniref:Uncharacterized protein n=1 Tax=Leucogyrophana mollusca TaxID=85980 RepID=A0ACB8BSJ5_9AGAM|nr:hypothetical protein BV22DRAFT_252227 [Leucogyrophana mollusca]
MPIRLNIGHHFYTVLTALVIRRTSTKRYQRIYRRRDSRRITILTNMSLCSLPMPGDKSSCHFDHFGNPTDVNNAIRIASRLPPVDHPNGYKYMANLGNSFSLRFQRPHKLSDIDKSAIKEPHNSCQTDIPMYKRALLSNLSESHFLRVERSSARSDLDRSASAREDAVAFAQDHRPRKLGRPAKLGDLVFRRFEYYGKLADPDTSIAMRACRADHPKTILESRQSCPLILTRFKRLSRRADLDICTSMSEEAMQLLADVHPSKPDYLGNLGTSASPLPTVTVSRIPRGRSACRRIRLTP